MTEKLAEFLKLTRNKLGLSLRDVEKETGISNAYLSQIEKGIAKNPTPAMLHKLSKCYKTQYEDLMRLAGYLKTGTTKTPDIERQAEIALMATGLNAEQVLEVMKYAEYVREAVKRKAGS